MRLLLKKKMFTLYAMLSIASLSYSQLELIDLVQLSELDNMIGSTNSLVANTLINSSVDALGNANMSVPINVPSGINGMTPQLSFAYSSAGGDGIMGRNWNLSGLSAISRGGDQYFVDQNISAPSHVSADAYYIDGQRLVHYAGNYGQANSIYYKRAYDNTIVKAIGAESTGPAWFQLKAAGGMKLDYGNDVDYNSDAVKFHSDGTKLIWALSRSSDCDGNYIDYRYDNNMNSGRQLYLTNVYYGGNLNAGTSHMYEIRITYANHSIFESKKYSNGFPVAWNEKVIDRVDVYLNSSIIRTYKLYYAELQGHILLQKIQESTPNGDLEPILFFTGTEMPGIASQVSTNIPSATLSNIPEHWLEIAGDYNSDGFTDYIAFGKNINYPQNGNAFNVQYVYINQKNGQFQAELEQGLYQGSTGYTGIAGLAYAVEQTNFSAIDINADGGTDLVYPVLGLENSYYSSMLLNKIGVHSDFTQNGSTGSWGNSNELFIYGNYKYVPEEYLTKNSLLQFGNFDGNFKSDIFYVLKDINGAKKAFVTLDGGAINSAHQIEVQFIGAAGALTIFPEKLVVIDFDGDGDSEIFSVTNNGDVIVVDLDISQSSSGVYSCVATMLYNSNGEFPAFNSNEEENLFYVQDLNNDGISDFLISNDEGFSWLIYTGKGLDIQGYSGGSYAVSSLLYTGALSSFGPFPGNNNIPQKELQFGDFDGDGYIDVFSRRETYYWLSSNNGTSLYFDDFTSNGVLSMQSGVSSLVGDFDGDGLSELLTTEDGANKRIVDFYFSPYFDIVNEMEDGFGNSTLFTFSTLSKGLVTSNYNLTGNATYPFVELAGGKPIVVRKTINGASTENGNSQFTEYYEYEQLTIDIQGSGTAGFKKITSTNNYNSLKTESELAFDSYYHYAYPTHSRVRALNNSVWQNTQASNNFLSTTYQTYSVLPVSNPDLSYLLLPLETTDYNYLNGTKNRKLNTWGYNDQSSGYRLIQSETYIGEPLVGTGALHIDIQFFEGTASDCNNFLVLPEHSVVNSQRQGESSETIFSQFSYSLNGKLNSKISYSTGINSVTAAYAYNQWGKVASTQVSSSGLPTKTSYNVYGYGGRYAVNATNALGQTSPQNMTYDERFGLPTKKVMLNGNEEYMIYDDLGRLKTITDIYGNITSISYDWVLNYGNGASLQTPDNAIYSETTSYPDGYEIIEYFDRQGNLRFTEDNNSVKTATTYDLLGRVDKSTMPFKDVNDIVYQNNDYDELGRPAATTVSSGGESNSYSYSNPAVGQTLISVTSSLGNKQIYKDATNQIYKVIDNGGVLTYSFNSFNKPKAIHLDNVLVSKMTYDSQGRQLSLTESASGTTSYTYNAYGQLTSQTTGGNITEWFTYDVMGRGTGVWMYNNTVQTKTMTYHNSGPGINQLSTVSNNQGELVTYDYNGYGDLLSTNYPNDNLMCAYLYDNYGRLAEEDYNNGMQRMRYGYSNTGELANISTKAQNEPFFSQLSTAISTNAFGASLQRKDLLGQTVASTYNLHGRLTAIELPGQLDFQYSWNNSTGNLNSRTDHSAYLPSSLTEAFTYDNLNRLKNVYLNGALTHQYSYDSRGNLMNKEAVGEYAYNNQFQNTYVENVFNEINTSSSQLRQFSPENELSYLKEGGYQFFVKNHADNHTRKSSRTTLNSVDIEKREYFPEIGLERFTNVLTNKAYNLFYVSHNGEMVAMVVKEAQASNPNNYTSLPNEGYYGVITDHLGSISYVYDQNGVVAKQSFDAWGRRRNPDDWTYTVNSTPNPEWLFRGYTGHEQLDYFGLIHMNGRVYSPLEGRMISPDNFVQDPYNSQSYNRYAYGFNNPLKYTDPNGEWVHLVVGAAIGGVVNLAMNHNKVDNFWDGLKYFGVGAAAGALSAGVGAGISTAMAGGSFGVGFVGISSGVSATGVISGYASGSASGYVGGFLLGTGNSLIQGQSFSSSLSAGFNEGASQMIVGGIIGGVVGGISASTKGVNVFTGEGRFDLSNGVGAHDVPYGTETVSGRYVGKFEGVNMYESSQLGSGVNSGGITLPGRGIVVGEYAYSRGLSMDLVHHEFGHILQARIWGNKTFYSVIGSESLSSATFTNTHNTYWTETYANYLSSQYFGSGYYANPVRFPIENVSVNNFVKLSYVQMIVGK